MRGCCRWASRSLTAPCSPRCGPSTASRPAARRRSRSGTRRRAIKIRRGRVRFDARMRQILCRSCTALRASLHKSRALGMCSVSQSTLVFFGSHHCCCNLVGLPVVAPRSASRLEQGRDAWRIWCTGKRLTVIHTFCASRVSKHTEHGLSREGKLLWKTDNAVPCLFQEPEAWLLSTHFPSSLNLSGTCVCVCACKMHVHVYAC